jgi:predicted glycosyltransferase
VVPFAEGREDEQTRRAARLAGMGALRVLSGRRLDGVRLAGEIRKVLAFRPAPMDLNVDGAAQTRRILSGMVGT